MKRVAFCDGIIPDLYLGHTGAYNMETLSKELSDRITHNIELMESIESRFDLVRYTKIIPERIKKDHPDALITYVNDEDEVYPARLCDIKRAKEENPQMKVLAYTDKDKDLDYDKYLKNGADDVLWRGWECFDSQIGVIMRWLEEEDEKA
ncbi:hypothetical protein GF361_02670 [Candidatus Woesearchaeota archaeon]|nr:hypothetical protein [Candidatus Woesearchaeota archaeon]